MSPKHRNKAPDWPSLDEQLAAAGAVHGSALEQLIRHNQELEMLDPEEVDDSLRIPPWLRVHWRKHHPDSDYSGPRHGYPLILRDSYSWMIRHQDLEPVRKSVPDIPAARAVAPGRRKRAR